MPDNHTFRFAATPCGTGSATTRCHNLRPDSSGALRPVGRPDTVAPAGHRPLLRFTADCSPALLTARGRELYLCPDTPGGKPRLLHTLASEPLCAIYSEGVIHISTAEGAESICTDGTATGHTLLPAIGLRAAAATRTLRADVPQRTLGGDYRQQSTLSATDRRAVSDDIRRAYTTLCREAGAGACLMQPALAAYELLDASGRVLFASPVLLLGTAQCTAAQRLAVASDGSLPGYTLQAYAWTPQLVFPADTGSVHSVRVYMSPQLHPVDPSADASVGLAHSTTATSVGVSLAPSGLILESKNAEASAHTLREAAARFAAIKRTIAVVPVVPGTAVDIPCRPAGTPAAELSAIATALTHAVPQTGGEYAAVSAPHSFSARTAAVAGHTAAWADITARRYAGYPLGIFAADADNTRAWSAWAAVEFAGGERVVWQGSGAAGAPLSVNPLLSYPAADAVRISIAVRAEGLGTACYNIGLTPLSGGREAMAVAESFAPVSLAYDGVTAPPPLQAPEAIVADRHFPEMIIAADAATPFSALAVTRLDGRVHRLLPAGGGTGAWDYGRTRFTAFGADGIHLATLNAGRDTLATARITGRSIASPQAVAAAEGCAYAAAGGDIVRVSGSKVAVVAGRMAADAIVWNQLRAELWALRRDTTEATVLCLASSPARSYTHQAEWTDSLLCDENGAFLLQSSGLLALHRESDHPASVEWTATLCLRERLRIVRSLIAASCGDAELDIAISAAGMHHAEPVPTRRLHLSGALLEALPVATLMRPLRSLQVSVSGSVHPDFQLRHIDLACRK